MSYTITSDTSGTQHPDLVFTPGNPNIVIINPLKPINIGSYQFHILIKSEGGF